MKSNADHNQMQKSRAVANAIAQRQTTPASALPFSDNRPEAMAQRKLQEMGNESMQAGQAAPVQMKAGAPPGLPGPVVQKKQNNTGLPDALKSGAEQLSGYSLDDVRVHYNSDKPAQLQAHAYAQGTDIHLASGQERHLAHEAWHVVQQMQGRVQPTMQAYGANINDNSGLEQEADRMGEQALQTKAAEPFMHGAPHADVSQLKKDTSGQKVVQRVTSLVFGNDLTGRNRITASRHTRSAVNRQSANWVLDFGAWKTVPGGEVCNHSKGYDRMAQKILDAIHNEKLYKASKTVKDTYEELQNNNMGLGAPTSTHANRLQDVIDDPDDDVNADNIVDSFHYYIYKICDYPRNLFFWPDRTGGNPDNPFGEFGDSKIGPWEVQNPIISKKKRLADEKKRLKKGREDLEEALP